MQRDRGSLQRLLACHALFLLMDTRSGARLLRSGSTAPAPGRWTRRRRGGHEALDALRKALEEGIGLLRGEAAGRDLAVEALAGAAGEGLDESGLVHAVLGGDVGQAAARAQLSYQLGRRHPQQVSRSSQRGTEGAESGGNAHAVPQSGEAESRAMAESSEAMEAEARAASEAPESPWGRLGDELGHALRKALEEGIGLLRGEAAGRDLAVEALAGAAGEGLDESGLVHAVLGGDVGQAAARAQLSYQLGRRHPQQVSRSSQRGTEGAESGGNAHAVPQSGEAESRAMAESSEAMEAEARAASEAPESPWGRLGDELGHALRKALEEGIGLLRGEAAGRDLAVEALAGAAGEGLDESGLVHAVLGGDVGQAAARAQLSYQLGRRHPQQVSRSSQRGTEGAESGGNAHAVPQSGEAESRAMAESSEAMEAEARAASEAPESPWGRLGDELGHALRKALEEGVGLLRGEAAGRDLAVEALAGAAGEGLDESGLVHAVLGGDVGQAAARAQLSYQLGRRHPQQIGDRLERTGRGRWRPRLVLCRHGRGEHRCRTVVRCRGEGEE